MEGDMRCQDQLDISDRTPYMMVIHPNRKGPQRKAFISQHEEVDDEDGYIIEAEQYFDDSDPEEDSSPYSVYQSSFHPKMPQKSYLPPKIW